MKNPHGIARELMINEQIDKKALLDAMVQTYGFEDAATIELFQMNERGESYAMMLAYKKLVDGAAAEGWFGFEV